ncbi:SagB/ThcOx family dehydrogenase [Streptomyces sp. NPDC055036]
MDTRTLFRRNPDLLLEWDDDSGSVLVDSRSGRKFVAKPELVDLLGRLDGPLTADELNARWPHEADAETTRKLLERLASAGIVRHDDKEDAEPAADGLTPYERACHAQAGRGPLPGTRRGTPPPARLRHPEATGTVPLPDARDLPSRALAEVLSERRSVRDFAAEPVPLRLLAAFLDRSARVRGYLPPRSYEQTQRPAPSGGARHSLEIYLIARDVEQLPPGAYHYDAFDHALHRLSDWNDDLAALQHRTITLPALLNEAPPAGLYLASRADRTGWKYAGMALSMIYRDTGCLLQTMCLTATDLGLASCPTGRMEVPVSAPFLQPYEQRLLHVGNLALGLPDPSATTTAPTPGDLPAG